MNWLPNCRPRDIVLLYHRIARVVPDPWELCVTPEHFVEHLEVLRKCQPSGPNSRSRVVHWELTPGRITFDDGYADNLYEAAPCLSNTICPHAFIATGYMGGTREFWWDELERIVFQSKCRTTSNIRWRRNKLAASSRTSRRLVLRAKARPAAARSSTRST